MLSRGSFGLGLLPKSGELVCGEGELVFDLMRRSRVFIAGRQQMKMATFVSREFKVTTIAVNPNIVSSNWRPRKLLIPAKCDSVGR
jgi:hypothetical protein